jgi:hypothetical protein
MNKYLYTILALVMVNLHAQELSSTPIKAVTHEFGSELNAYEEKASKVFLKVPQTHMSELLCPYAGLTLFGINAGVAYRNKNSTMEIDVRYNSGLFFTSGSISISRIIMLRERNKMDPMGYVGLGSGIGVCESIFRIRDQSRVLFIPRVFYGVESVYGFCDFGVCVPTLILETYIGLPHPDLRWGFRF